MKKGVTYVNVHDMVQLVADTYNSWNSINNFNMMNISVTNPQSYKIYVSHESSVL